MSARLSRPPCPSPLTWYAICRAPPYILIATDVSILPALTSVSKGACHTCTFPSEAIIWWIRGKSLENCNYLEWQIRRTRDTRVWRTSRICKFNILVFAMYREREFFSSSLPHIAITYIERYAARFFFSTKDSWSSAPVAPRIAPLAQAPSLIMRAPLPHTAARRSVANKRE